MGADVGILFAVIMISVGIATGLAMLVAMRRRASGTTFLCVISASCLVIGAVIFLAIDDDPGGSFFFSLIWLGILTGLGALIAFICRAHLSRTLGMISVGCFCILMILVSSQGFDPLSAIYFLLFSTPGLIGLVCARAPRPQPGHCTNCGYNLTGNVSGKCSECGAPVVAP